MTVIDTVPSTDVMCCLYTGAEACVLEGCRRSPEGGDGIPAAGELLSRGQGGDQQAGHCMPGVAARLAAVY